MTREEYQRTRKYVEAKALELMKREKKEHAITGVPLENYRVIQVEGRTFYIVQTNTFKFTMEEVLLRAQKSTPEKFGTGDAIDVIEAMRLQQTWPIELPAFAEFITSDKCAYVFESEFGYVKDKMLRLDLARLIRPNKNKEKNEFIGGLLHAFKHFSKEGINYSTGKSNHSLKHPYELVDQIVLAFFTAPGIFENQRDYIVKVPYMKKRKLKFVFYRQENTGIYFLKTTY